MGLSRRAQSAAGSTPPSPVVLKTGPLLDRPGLRVAGEVSLATYSVWERLLEELAGRDEKVCHLELSAVTFVDVHGATALATIAQTMEDGRHIVLYQPPASLQRTLEVFWPDLPGLEVAHCRQTRRHDHD